MKRKLIIEKYGSGHAVAVLNGEKIVDLFIDPPPNANFYSPNTFIEAKIQRRISKRGGYFIQLPNKSQGFLKSKSHYNEGEVVVLLSKVFFDEDKPQTFTDKLKIKSKYFVLKLGESGFSVSRKIPKNFNKDRLIPLLDKKIKNHKSIFLICRSRIADISFEQSTEELERILLHYNSVMNSILKKKFIVKATQKEAY